MQRTVPGLVVFIPLSSTHFSVHKTLLLVLALMQNSKMSLLWLPVSVLFHAVHLWIVHRRQDFFVSIFGKVCSQILLQVHEHLKLSWLTVHFVSYSFVPHMPLWCLALILDSGYSINWQSSWICLIYLTTPPCQSNNRNSQSSSPAYQPPHSIQHINYNFQFQSTSTTRHISHPHSFQYSKGNVDSTAAQR